MTTIPSNHTRRPRRRSGARGFAWLFEHGTRIRRSRRRGRGFTLIEMVITVAVIGILAAIVVPKFTSETRKAKASSEVNAMFGELAIRQDQYKLENGRYVAAAACPSAPATRGQDASGCLSTAWDGLRVRLPQEKIACSYEMVAGVGVGTDDPLGFSFTSPAGAWFYIVATCNGDNDSGTNAQFFTSSASSAIQKQDEGS
ncbi:MAG: type IV pilin protein [Kofleriaceae bacterium]